MGIRAKELHHFILFPLMGQGHLIPMVDIARMLAERGVIITIFTTTQNTARFEGVLNRAKETGLRINLLSSHLLCVPETDFIAIPDLPDKIDVMKAQLPEPRTSEMKEF
ncbi:hypothetical protein G4B88_007959 [Cannabis sativa]|uniref:Uncharacterized protein n=1 Tax=Cannabis sativa TaxID=3483 RepID=A0A7J6I6X6_CANSA|nr:hypothetical protein G4B88_007959 [Cannabis sativa]